METIEKVCEGECPNCGCTDIDWHDTDSGDGWKSHFGICDHCGGLIEEQYSINYALSICEIESPEEEEIPALFSDNPGGESCLQLF